MVTYTVEAHCVFVWMLYVFITKTKNSLTFIYLFVVRWCFVLKLQATFDVLIIPGLDRISCSTCNIENNGPLWLQLHCLTAHKCSITHADTHAHTRPHRDFDKRNESIATKR